MAFWTETFLYDVVFQQLAGFFNKLERNFIGSEEEGISRRRRSCDKTSFKVKSKMSFPFKPQSHLQILISHKTLIKLRWTLKKQSAWHDLWLDFKSELFGTNSSQSIKVSKSSAFSFLSDFNHDWLFDWRTFMNLIRGDSDSAWTAKTSCMMNTHCE